MQDRLKFRYFNKHSKKMVYPDNYQNANAIYECLEQQVCFDENLPILPYDHISNGLIFMQCTGLKDKNGLTLLYEGDIINNEGIKIGNCYENQDLLKETTNFIIKGMGTKKWRSSEQEAIKRGCYYAE